MKLRNLLVALLLAGVCLAEEPPNAPWLDRLEPFGAAQGETLEVRIVGERLGAVESVALDTDRIVWLETLAAEPDSVTGRVRVAENAALGAHTIHLTAPNGRSNSRLFYVDALPSRSEAEPNDAAETAQAIELEPQVLHGALPELVDRDSYSFQAKAGERWVFDVRSIEYGGFLESELSLLDAEGRLVAFNDDRDDYLETPTLEHVFERDGTYRLLIDQYRGPQRVNCDANCGYMLRISQAPRLEAAHPLGARRGATVRMSLRGSGMAELESVWLVPARNAEHSRLTFPHTIPVRADQEPAPDVRIEGKILARSDAEAEVELAVPADAPLGLWRLWAASPAGPADGPSFLVDERTALSEAEAREQALEAASLAVDGSLDAPGEEDVYRLQVRAGESLHAYVLAVQMGLPRIDPVLELFDAGGEIVAAHDDLMSGQGTVIGNLDASLYYTPEEDGELFLHVRDRIGRGGPSYVYRLILEPEEPGFGLITDAENPQVERGGESRLGVLLIRDPGFDQAVEVWAEEVPAGLQVGRGRFRADQFFGPSGDGDNVVIPEVFLDITSDDATPTGAHRLRVLGRAEDGRVVEAYSTLWIGPPRKRNDVRRPLPAISLTVVDPEAASSSEPSAAKTSR